jgi:hypothetical protein
MSTPGWVDCCPRSTDDLIGGSNVSCTTVKHRSGSAGSVQLVGWNGGVRHEDERWKCAVGRVEGRCQTRDCTVRTLQDNASKENTQNTQSPPQSHVEADQKGASGGSGAVGAVVATHSKHRVAPTCTRRWKGADFVIMRMMVRLMAVGTHNTHSRRGSRWARMARCGWMVVRIEVQCNMRTCAPQQMRAHHTTHPHTLLNKKRSVGG